MNFDYEASILQSLWLICCGQVILSVKIKQCLGVLHAKRCLATAEIEYEERKDPSIYVLFPLEQTLVDRVFPTAQQDKKLAYHLDNNTMDITTEPCRFGQTT